MIMFGTTPVRRSKRLSTSLSTEKAMKNTPLYSHCKGRGERRRSLGQLNLNNDIYEASSCTTPTASVTNSSPIAAEKENTIGDGLYKSVSIPLSGDKALVGGYASDAAERKDQSLVSSPELSTSARALFDSYDEAGDEACAESIKSDGNQVAGNVEEAAGSEFVVESAMEDEEEEWSDEYLLSDSNNKAVKLEGSDYVKYAVEESDKWSSDELDGPNKPSEQKPSEQKISSEANGLSKPAALSTLRDGMIVVISAMEVLEREFGGDVTTMLSNYAGLLEECNEYKSRCKELSVSLKTMTEGRDVLQSAYDILSDKYHGLEATNSKLSNENQDLMASLDGAKANLAKARDEAEAQKEHTLALISEKEEAHAKFTELEANPVRCMSEKESSSSENTNLKTQVEQLTRKLEAVGLEREALSSELASKATRAEIKALESEKEEANAKSTALQASLIKCSSEKDVLSAKIADLKSQVDDANGKLSTTMAECSGYKAELDQFVSKFQALRSERDTLIEEKSDANVKLAALSEEKSALEHELVGIQAEKSTLDLCLKEHVGHKNALEDQNAELKSQLDNAQDNISTLVAERAGCKIELEQMVKEKVGAEDKLAALDKELASVKAERDNAIQKALGHQKKELEKAVSEGESLKINLRMTTRECVRLEEELTREKANSDSLVDRVDTLQIDLVRRNMELGAIREEKCNLERDIEEKMSIIAGLQGMI